MKFLFTFLLCGGALLLPTQSEAQTFTDAQAAKAPLWIDLIEDTTANYFAVERAFDLYFQNHELPEGEHEDIGGYAERQKHFSKRARRRADGENTLRLNVKRYEKWHRQMQPYVQPDGRILTPTERLAVWQAQQGAE